MISSAAEVKTLTAGALVLSNASGQEKEFVRTFTDLEFRSKNIQIETQFAYSSTVRTPDGDVIGEFADIADYFETRGSYAEYDVQSVETVTTISCEAVCPDRIFALESGKSVRRVENYRINFLLGDKSRVELNLLCKKNEQTANLVVDVFCEDEQFQTILGYLGFSSVPAHIAVSVSVPCFQSHIDKIYGAYCTDIVLECGIVSAKLEGIHIQRQLPNATGGPKNENIQSVRQSVPDDLSVYAAEIARSVWRIELVVGFAAAVLLASAILTWF